MNNRSNSIPRGESAQAVVYARVSSKEQEREGYSIPAQLKVLRDYALHLGVDIAREFVDVETAKQAGRGSFGEMLKFLALERSCRALLVEKTDRLYRNLKDWVSIDELELEIHLVKENVILSHSSRSAEKFMHGIKVLMAKNYIDNLAEEVSKGLREKAEQVCGRPSHHSATGTSAPRTAAAGSSPTLTGRFSLPSSLSGTRPATAR